MFMSGMLRSSISNHFEVYLEKYMILEQYQVFQIDLNMIWVIRCLYISSTGAMTVQGAQTATGRLNKAV